jgi:hypothetical protein
MRAVLALRVVIEFQENEVVPFREKFSNPSLKDPEWLTNLSKEKDWVIISADPRITRGRAERAAWKESGFVAFFFIDGWANNSIYVQTADIISR